MNEQYDEIITAIANGQSKAANKLIDQFSDISYIDIESGRALIHWAAQEGDVKVIEHLVRKGVNVDCLDINGETALYITIGENCYNASKLLLESKANVNHLCGSDGSSLLFLAVNWADDSLISLLLSYGADPFLPNNLNKTALDEAKEANRYELIKMFRANQRRGA